MSDVILQGTHFDGRSATGAAATLIVAGRQVSLVGATRCERFERTRLRVSPLTGTGLRFVQLPDGGQFQCAHAGVLDRLPQEVSSEGLAAWLERRWSVALASLALVIALLVAAYVFLLPVAAERIARHISPATERALGDEALAWMDRNHWFVPSQVDAALQYRLLGRFADLVHGLPQEAHYTLVFRASPRFGANAFALPGGVIVVTDEMLDAAQSEEEVLSVLAHEIGHVERRHATRNILHRSIVALVATGLTADASSAGTAVAGLPVFLTQMNYSRAFEAEADAFAFGLLRRHGLSPAAFADFMERLHAGDEDDAASTAFLSSHPLTADRVARARAAADGRASGARAAP